METVRHEALLYEKLPDSRVQCHTCQWGCKIAPDKFGVCGMYQNKDGVLDALNYALVSSMAIDPIEKKPLFHLYPGTSVFSLGSLGCNFHCKHCQNWEISFGTPEADGWMARYISPKEAIELTMSTGCQGIAWTYNDPSIWLEYTIDCARLAHEKG